MKKVLFPILALILAVALVIPMVLVSAHTEESPYVADLLAGQTEDVGDVKVWNDGTNLYVKYETTGGWEMTETHLHVADDSGDIPQTKYKGKGKGTGGNPIPGQFDYQMEHDPAVTTYTYTIPLGDWVPCTDLDIAAQAEVRKLSDPIPASLASGAGTDNVLVIPEDTTDYPTGYPGPYVGTTVPSVVIQGDANADPGVWPTITGAQWISDNLTNPGSANSWRLFTRSFNIPLNAINFSGTLQITSDNAEEAMLNGMPAAGLVDGEVYGVFGDDGEWNTVLSHPVGSYLQPGANMLQVMVRNYYSDVDWNWTGLVYKMDYEYQLILATETAWAADDGPGTIGFPGKNWATYFEYHVQGGIGETGDEWTEVASNYTWEARARHGGAGGWRAFVDDVFPPVNPLYTGGTVPWLNGGQMWFELIYDDSSHNATFTIYDSSDDSVLGTVTDSGLPGFDGLIGIQGKTSPEAAGSVIVDNVEVNGVGLYGDDGFTAQGTDFVRDLAYLDISGVLPGSFTLTGNLTFTWGANPKDEGPALSIYVQCNP